MYLATLYYIVYFPPRLYFIYVIYWFVAMSYFYSCIYVYSMLLNSTYLLTKDKIGQPNKTHWTKLFLFYGLECFSVAKHDIRSLDFAVTRTTINKTVYNNQYYYRRWMQIVY